MNIIRLRTFNYQQAKKHGFKAGFTLGLLYWLIECKSRVKIWDHKKGWMIDPLAGLALLHADALIEKKNGDFWYYAVHTELEYSPLHGGLSASATTVDDGPACFRLKKILYSNPERWDTIEFQVTEEQERKMFTKACKMADIPLDIMLEKIRHGWIADKETFHGPKALPYDKLGVFVCNISRKKIIDSSPKSIWCTESACEQTNEGELTKLESDLQIPAQYHIGMMELAKINFERK